MEDDLDDMKGLLDDDPALDYILYEDMTQDHKDQNKSGCLGLVLLFLLPITTAFNFWSKWT